MGPLATRIGKIIESQEVDLEEVVETFLKHHENVEGADVRPEASVVESMLERLLAGERAGREFFFQDEKLLRSLSAAVELEVEDLEELREAQDAFRVLILDPRLPLAPRRYFKRQQVKNAGVFAVIEPQGRRLDDLKDAARDVPRPIVVLTDDGDESEAEQFTTEGIETSTVYWHRRGYLLEAAPELVPEPPAPPPRLVDDDGMPMIPLEDLEREILEGEDSAEKGRVKEIFEQGGIPTFRVDDALRYLARDLDEPLLWAKEEQLDGADSLFSRWLERAKPIQVWCHDRKLFYIGKEESEALEIIREHHPVTLPPSFGAAKKRLEGLNPFLCVDEAGEPHFTGPWLEIRDMVLEECGVDIASSFPLWRERIEQRAEPRHSITQRARAIETKARSAIESLILRPISIDVAEADIVFVLRSLAQAPLVVLPPEALDAFHVVADLGDGRMLWARALSFSDEQPRPLRRFAAGPPWDGYEDTVSLDGGDIHLWLRLHRSAWLGGDEELR